MTNSTEQLNKNGDRRGMNLNSQKNLRGVQGIGNPKNDNAKKELSITRKQREMLPLPCPYAPDKTWLEYIAERGLALAGENASYYKELLDRLEGKVSQPTEVDVRGHIEIEDARQKLLDRVNNLASYRAKEASGSGLN